MLSDLCKSYASSRVKANDGISLEIQRGEIFGVFGPNGAGKTTLVKQIAGLLRPTSGKISLFGHDVVAQPQIVPNYVAYYGQRIPALRAYTLKEVLLHTAVLRGMAPADARKSSAELIERFDLGASANRMMVRLSGGQQRQAALLASLIGSLPVLILDEPTNELDPAIRKRVWDYLWGLNQQEGKTIVLVTHNVLEAEQVVERVAIINHGRLVAIGTPGELKRQVDSSVRIEVRLKHRVDGKEVLGRFPGVTCLREGHYRINVAREKADETFRDITRRVGLDSLDDFRLITPTLEDVYIKCTAAGAENAGRNIDEVAS